MGGAVHALSEWENEFMHICFNDACPYLVRGWDVMNKQGNRGISYRLMYDPLRDRFMPVPCRVALRDGIMDEDGTGEVQAV